MPLITKLRSRTIFNSRGEKTVEVDVVTDNKYLGRCSSPSGASVGKHEVQSFPDNDAVKAVQQFRSYAERFIGIDAAEPKLVFETLRSIDNTLSYSKIGGSIAYALSIAAVDSAAKALDIPIIKLLKKSKPYKNPFPLGNILGGGAHAGPGTPDIQEILTCPVGATSIIEALEMNFKVHKELRKVIETADKSFTYGRGDEGAWAPRVNNDEALQLAEKAIKNSGFTSGTDIRLGIDFASSSLWDKYKQTYEYTRQRLSRTTDEQIDYINSLINRYNLIYAEDPVHEEDFQSMAELTRKNPECIVSGDDILVTNTARVKEASKYKACSGAILKVNQAGTLYEALEFAEQCNRNNIRIITSHRSGESVDSHIAHIAIATGSRMLKSGVIGGERVSKLNELVRLAEYDLIEGMVDLSI
jgi:enolase